MRSEQRRFRSDGAPEPHRIQGTVTIDEAPATHDDISRLAWRMATPGERAIAVARSLWTLAVAVWWWLIVTVTGAFVGLLADPRGVGCVVGGLLGFTGYGLVLAILSAPDDL